MTEVTKDPIERHVADIIAENYSYGDIIPTSVLAALLECEEPEFCTPKELDDIRFKRLSRIGELKRILLEETQLMLDPAHGKGYRVVPPKEQTAVTMSKMSNRLNKETLRAATSLANVRLEELSVDQQREHAGAICRLASMRQQARKALTAKTPKIDDLLQDAD